MDRRRFNGVKKLVSLLGAEYDIMERSASSVMEKFYFSSLAIVVIFFISFLSIWYAINLLFHAFLVELFLSLFLSLLFVCIYIFLLHTFAKKQLGKEVVKRSFRQSLFNPTNVMRTGFVVFMAFMISKPVEIYVFEGWLNEDVRHYQKSLLADHQKAVDQFYENDLLRALTRKAQIEELGLYSGADGRSELALWNSKIDSLQKEKERVIEVASRKIEIADFFIYRIKTVTGKYPLSLLLCGAMIALFLLPGYLIYTLSENDAYYELKKRLETAMVLKHYHAMTKTYADTFGARYNHTVDIYTVYEDPPFNTKRKIPPVYSPQAEFLKKFSS